MVMLSFPRRFMGAQLRYFKEVDLGEFSWKAIQVDHHTLRISTNNTRMKNKAAMAPNNI